MIKEMWTWLSIVILARVLFASNEADFQGRNLDQQQQQQQQRQQVIRSDTSNGDTSEEMSQATIKPIPNNDQIRCKDEEVFQGGGGTAPLCNGKVRLYNNRIDIGGLGSIIKPLKPIEYQPNNDDDEDNKKGKRSLREFGNLDSPPGFWIPSTMNLRDKTPRLFQEQANPLQEMKKIRAFSPWGGKRVPVLGQGSKVRRPIRVPFNSWGGKRGYEGATNSWRFGASDDLEKRTRFSSWGGKRGYDLDEKFEANGNGLVEKRMKFNAWGGKRSKNGERDDEEMKRTRFHAWGGKRNDITVKRTPEEIFAKKSVFNAWGGKRFATHDQGKTSLTENDVYNKLREGNDENGVNFWSLSEGERRRITQPGLWKTIESSGGGEYLEEGAASPKVSFKGEIMALPDRRGGGEHLQRSYFSPWGGRKRSQQEEEEEEEEKKKKKQNEEEEEEEEEGAASLQNIVLPAVSTDLEKVDQQIPIW